MNKEQKKEEMKKIAAKIGRLQIMRGQGIYVPMSKIIKLQKEFQKLSVAHKQERLAF